MGLDCVRNLCVCLMTNTLTGAVRGIRNTDALRACLSDMGEVFGDYLM